MMSEKDGSVGLCALKQEIGRHHDGRKHVVEVVRDAAGELTDGIHLLLLLDLVFERAPLGIVERIDDGGFRIALAVVVDGGDEEARRTLGAVRQGRIDRIDIALPLACLCDRLFERDAVAFGDGRQDRALAAFRRQRP